MPVARSRSRQPWLAFTDAAGELGLGDTVTRAPAIAAADVPPPAIDFGGGRTAVAMADRASSACAFKCRGGNLNGGLRLCDTTPCGRALGQLGDALPTVDLGTGHTARQLVALRSPFDGDTF